MKPIIVSIILLALASCAETQRTTSEVAFPHYLTVEWPEGITEEDVQTTTVDGYTISVAPYEQERAE